MQIDTLIDDIYEASVIPERWIGVLDRMARIADGEGTLLFTDTPGQIQWICSAAIHDVIEKWSSEWLERNTRGHRLIAIREPRFLTDLDGFTREELEHEPLYRDFFRPNGLGWCVGTAIRSPSRDTLVFSVEKAYRKGPVEPRAARQLDLLRPHLARAALLSARIGLERAHATVQALQTMGLPAAVLRRDGRVFAVNALLEACASRIAIAARDNLLFAGKSAQAIFSEALAMLGAQSSGWTGRSFPVAGDATHAPVVAHLLPLRRAAGELFSGAAALLFVTQVNQNKAPAPDLLEALFDLTPTEAKVTSLLVGGKSVDAIATAQGVLQDTVRMQFKSVFAKTGARRQAELVSLLAMPSYTRTPAE